MLIEKRWRMRFKTNNEILVIKENDGGFGVRFLCNLSPEEMRERREEIIREFLKQWEFEYQIELDKEGETPTLCQDLNGFWSYFVKFN